MLMIEEKQEQQQLVIYREFQSSGENKRVKGVQVTRAQGKNTVQKIIMLRHFFPSSEHSKKASSNTITDLLVLNFIKKILIRSSFNKVAIIL